MSKKIQVALGRNAKTRHPDTFQSSIEIVDVGQAVIDSVAEYLQRYVNQDDGSALVTSIYSDNLRRSALFSSRSARVTYLLGKVTLLDSNDRKSVVRTQVIEYGAVAEAILIDVIQCIGKQNAPAGRPTECKRKIAIEWNKDGLFALADGSNKRQKHTFPFEWLTKQAKRLSVIDDGLAGRIDRLRGGRNLVHPNIPTADRYRSDLDSAKEARDVVIALRDACIAFKQAHNLPLPSSLA